MPHSLDTVKKKKKSDDLNKKIHNTAETKVPKIPRRE